MFPATNSPPFDLYHARRSAPPQSKASRPMWRHQVVPGEVRVAQAWGRLMGIEVGSEPTTQGPRPQVAPPSEQPRAKRRRPLRRALRLRLHMAVRLVQRHLGRILRAVQG